jgi:hypothetical protein
MLFATWQDVATRLTGGDQRVGRAQNHRLHVCTQRLQETVLTGIHADEIAARLLATYVQQSSATK